jgi:hypothetical protein
MIIHISTIFTEREKEKRSKKEKEKEDCCYYGLHLTLHNDTMTGLPFYTA